MFSQRKKYQASSSNCKFSISPSYTFVETTKPIPAHTRTELFVPYGLHDYWARKLQKALKTGPYFANFVPKMSDECWCKWQSGKLKGTSRYRKKLNLPVCIKRLLEPIFRDPSTDELLAKCLHGQTQNANEAFNAVLWQKCPKGIFVGRETLQLATNSAAIAYNDGSLRPGDV